MPLRRAAYTMLNIVVVRPMPSVSASTATNVRPRLFCSDRAPYRMSLRTACMNVGVGVPQLRPRRRTGFRTSPPRPLRAVIQRRAKLLSCERTLLRLPALSALEIIDGETRHGANARDERRLVDVEPRRVVRRRF